MRRAKPPERVLSSADKVATMDHKKIGYGLRGAVTHTAPGIKLAAGFTRN